MSTATASTRIALPAGARVRVAVREVREAAFRALIAAGASGGEAATAAQAVVDAEITDGSGLVALLAELHRLPTGRTPVSVRRGQLDMLDDPAQRGPLLLGPLAVDLAIAVDRPVVLPGIEMSTALTCVALTAAQHADAPLALATITGGQLTRWSAVMPGRTLAPLPAGEAPPYEGAIEVESGVLLRRLTATAVPAAVSADTARAAFTDGLYVDARRWARACCAARRFLMPDPPTDKSDLSPRRNQYLSTRHLGSLARHPITPTSGRS